MEHLDGAVLPPSEQNIGSDVQLQQYKLYRGSVVLSGVVVYVNAGIVALASILHGQSLATALAWYAFLAILVTIRFPIWLRRPVEGLEPDVVKRHMKEALAFATLIGGGFGLATPLFYSASDLPFLFFICVVVAGMCAGTAAVLNPIPKVVAGYVAAAILPMLGILIHDGSPLSLALGALAIVFATALVVGSRASYKQLRALVAASKAFATAEADLKDAVESTTDAFATFGNDGRIRQANRRFRVWFPETQFTDDVPSQKVPQQLSDGRWVIGALRPTTRGGFVSVHTDITALKKREDELIDARRQAEIADESKTRFLTTMSHELRTPLNIIIGFARLMGDGSNIKLSSAEVNEFAEHIRQSGDHLLHLINDIIDFTEVGSDSYQLTPSKVRVAALCDWVVSMATSFGKENRDVEFSVSISPDFPALWVDETAVRRVLVNVVENAIKFSVDRKSVSIRAGIDRVGSPFISVRDRGMGIPEDKISSVFDAFYQIDNTLNRSHGGTGLGLTLSRELMHLVGGDIAITSRVGEGTNVILRFPDSVLLSDDEIPETDPADIVTFPRIVESGR